MDLSAITDDDLDLRALRLDSERREPLKRVHYAEGMLLGIEATRAEQEYHRRRLVRHQHWLHGAGTVLGLAVAAHVHRTPTDPALPVQSLRPALKVQPGLALDGLGREVHLHEAYCLDLIDWLLAQGRDPRAGAFGADGIYRLPAAWLVGVRDLANARTPGAQGALHLRVTARYEACPRGMQPVFAHRLNDSTDAVDASRIGDGVMLELVPETSSTQRSVDFQGRPAAWTDVMIPADSRLDGQAQPADNLLSTAEAARLQALPAGDRPLWRQRARLLHAAGLPEGADTAERGVRPEILQARARILLARITIPMPDGADLALDPAAIAIDNLIRPFALPDALLPR